jgi:predicted acyl esterase
VRLVLADGRSFDSTQVAASGVQYLMMGAWHDHVFPHNRFPGAFAVAPPGGLMYLGTGGHGSENSPQELAFRSALTQSFFTEKLKGEYRGLDTVGPAVVATGPDWQHYQFDTWPPPDLGYVDYWLHADGTLSSVPPAADTWARLEHRRTNPGYTWEAAVADNFARTTGSFLRERRSFRTAPLVEPVTLMGIPRADVWAKGPSPRFQVNLQLYDEPPSGPVTYLTQVSLGVRDNPDSTQWQNLAGEFTIIGWEIAAGHRLRVDWTSIQQTLADTTLWWLPYWNADGMLTLGLDSLHLARINLPLLSPTAVLDLATPARCRAPLVSPNPCRRGELVRVNAGMSRVRVFDATGREHCTAPTPGLRGNDGSLRLPPDLVPGLYFLKLESGRQLSTARLVLQ